MTCLKRVSAITATVALFAAAGSALAQPANDNCADAAVITATTGFDSTGATTDGSASCGFQGDPGGQDIWFSFTAGTSDTHVFDTCGSSFDTILSIYDSCGGFELVCNDDNCGLQSRVNLALTQGTTYIIRVAGFDTDAGTGTLNVTVGTAGNDLCANAQAITADGQYAFDTTLATNDAAGSCGASAGSPDVWFAYTGTQTGTILVETCGLAGYDTVLSAYDSCGGAELICNDDSCGLQSRILVPVTAATPVLIRVSGFNNAVGTGSINVQFLTPPANDNCASAQVAVEGDNAFNNLGATTDGSASCGFGGDPGSSDVWFTYTATRDGLLTATTCPGALDTIVSIFDSCGGTELACGDDTGTGLCSRTLLTATNGTTYTIRVAAFGTGGGAGNLNVTVGDFPVPCLTAPGGSVAELENCGEDTNGGCNNAGLAVESISVGATVFGTAWADNGTRDTDWFEFSVAARSLVTVTMQSEFAGRTFILSNACPPAQFGTTVTTACGAPVTLTATVNPGTYRVFAGHNSFADTPCLLAGNTHYILNVQAEPLGACCTATGCQATTSSNCSSLGGVFQGAGTSCGGASYTSEANTATFEDISSTGVDSGIRCDDCTGAAPIGFTFRYGSTNFTSVNISSNGNLQFAPSNSAVFGNAPIPNAALPNNMIAPAWDDFNNAAQGTIFTETRGTAPSRQFIVSWQNVPQFANTDDNSFQVVLHETTNRIEFRYGTMTEQAAGDITVGVENAAGDDGLNLDATTVIGAGNSAITINASVIPNPCSATGACCQAGGNCSVITQAACSTAGGSWLGADTDCGVITYSAVESQEAFEDISGSGTASAAGNCDDCGEIVNIGFSFALFGNNFTQVAITSNGYLAFGPGAPLGDFGNDCPLPNAFTPNNIVCAAWDDWNTATAGDVYYLTDGDAPNRRFIASWQNVSQFAVNPPDDNSFQVILYEGSNDIEFRYGTMVEQAFCDITVGVENADGTAALSLDATAVIRDGNRALLVTDTATGGCGGGNPCPQDFNADGDVNGDDLADYINCFFSVPPCDQADINDDGDVNGDDLGDFINLFFGPPC